MKEYRLTKEGYENLIKEFDDLVNNKRKEIAERLKEAKENSGDLTENAEYEYAKNEQAFIEGRIEQISEIIKNHVIIKENVSNGLIELGSAVKVKDLETSREREFKIVSSIESDPDKNKISDESPLGRAILNKKAGEEVIFKTPGKTRKFKIIKVT